MDLIEGVFGRRQHPHIRSELFRQCLDHILRGRGAGHSDTLCGEVPRHSILEVKTHHAMELQVLKKEKEYNIYFPISLHIPLPIHTLLKSNYIMQIHHKAAAKVHLSPSAVYD